MNVYDTIEVEKNILFGSGDLVDFSSVKSLGYFLIDLLRKQEDKVGFIDAITDERITFRKLLNDSMEAATCYRSAGLQVGDTIAIVSENRLEFAITLYAALFIGVTVAPINASYTERELQHALALSQPKIVFTSPFAAKNVATAASQTTFVQKIIQFGDKLVDERTMLFQDFIKSYKLKPGQASQSSNFIPAIVNIMEHNALILCSSGTTGLPKGVQLTHFNLITTLGLFNGNNLLVPTTRTKTINDVKIMGIIPFFHVYGCVTLLGINIIGAVIVIVPRFEETFFVSCIEKYKITVLFTVPPLLVFLAKNPIVDKYDLTSIEIISCGAAPLSGETISAVENRLNNNVNIRQGYGLTEALAVLAQKPDNRKPGTVGMLLPSTYGKVVDPLTGEILGKNQAGELYFKGPQVMKGYIGNDEATRNSIDKDGWLHTGDVGYYDDEYNFFIVDRLKEIIKYKAYQVPPAEIESILLTNPKIKDAAVIGLPDEASGELPMAFVVCQANVTLTETEVVKFVEDRVSSAKRLRGGARFIDEIPKNPSGKILRRELRALLHKPKL